MSSVISLRVPGEIFPDILWENFPRISSRVLLGVPSVIFAGVLSSIPSGIPSGTSQGSFFLLVMSFEIPSGFFHWFLQKIHKKFSVVVLSKIPFKVLSEAPPEIHSRISLGILWRTYLWISWGIASEFSWGISSEISQVTRSVILRWVLSEFSLGRFQRIL